MSGNLMHYKFCHPFIKSKGVLGNKLGGSEGIKDKRWMRRRGLQGSINNFSLKRFKILRWKRRMVLQRKD